MENTMNVAHKKRPIHEYEYDLVGSFSSSSSSSLSGISNGSSLESYSFEEVTSLPSADPLSDMSSLFEQLPIKKGLSKYYQGKSQSFTSLASVRSLEDLVKAENPYNKRLKTCRSYEEGLGESQREKCTSNSAMSRHGSKKGLHSRGSCSSSLSARRGSGSFMGSKPPIPPHRSTNTTTMPNQTALFA